MGMGEWMKMKNQILVMSLLLSACARAPISTVSLPSYLSADGKTEEVFENASSTPILSLIRGAKKSIEIEIYEMGNKQVLNELQLAMDRGVSLRIIQEGTPVGNSCHIFEPVQIEEDETCQNLKSFLGKVKAKGGTYVPFAHDQLCGENKKNCFEHGKMIIIDQARVLISTGNFNLSNLCFSDENPKNCNRDFSVVSSDPAVVQTLGKIFEQDLKQNASELPSLLSSDAARKLTVSPFSFPPIKAFIQSARKTLQIENQYLNDPEMNQAILDAAAKGVKVQILVASACSFGKPKAGDVNRWNQVYGTFDQTGIQSRIFDRQMKVRGASGYLHAKVMIADGERAWVGSVNGSGTAIRSNREFGVFISDFQEVQKLVSYFEQDFKDPNGESWQESLLCEKDPRPASKE